MLDPHIANVSPVDEVTHKNMESVEDEQDEDNDVDEDMVPPKKCGQKGTIGKSCGKKK